MIEPVHDPLPNDPAALRVFAAALLERCTKLERLLKLANSAQFGKSSEKLSPDQLQLALEDIDRERFSLRTPVVMSERATSARGRTIGLREGEEFPLGELLQAMLVTSANDASVAVAERIRGSVEACVAAMNRRAQQLGMSQTEFQTVNGMPLSDGSAGDFSSARDLVTLARALLRHDLVLEWTSHDKVPFRDGSQMLPNTNRLVGKVDGVNGLKTGFTSRARFNLVATAQRGSLSLIAVVLGGRSSRVRFQSAEQFLEWGFTNYHDQVVSSREKDTHGHGGQPVRAALRPCGAKRRP